AVARRRAGEGAQDLERLLLLVRLGEETGELPPVLLARAAGLELGLEPLRLLVGESALGALEALLERAVVAALGEGLLQDGERILVALEAHEERGGVGELVGGRLAGVEERLQGVVGALHLARVLEVLRELEARLA